MNWDRLTTVEEMESATNSLLENGPLCRGAAAPPSDFTLTPGANAPPGCVIGSLPFRKMV